MALSTMSSSITAAVKNVAGEDYIYPSNSENETETENVEPNKNDDNGDKPNSYGLQETVIFPWFIQYACHVRYDRLSCSF